MTQRDSLVLALDADPVGRDGSGNETYLRGIIGGMQARMTPEERLVLVGSHPDALWTVASGATSVLPVSAGLKGEISWGRTARKAGATVALGHWNAPIGFAGPKAVILHDVAFRRVPDTYPTLLRLRLEVFVRRATRVSDLIVTVSEFSRNELLDCYPRLDPSRVVVARNAPHARFSAPWTTEALDEVRTRLSLPDRFALAVGNLQPRKNLIAAAEACERVGIPLVVAGRPIWGNGTPDPGALSAQWLGYVDSQDLPALYRLCRTLVYPSLYEGFGLPVIEAMAAGAPVVCSSTSALPEAAGGAALLAPPRDIDALAEAVAAVVADDSLAASLSAAGVQRAAKLAWEESAANLLVGVRSLHDQASLCAA